MDHDLATALTHDRIAGLRHDAAVAADLARLRRGRRATARLHRFLSATDRAAARRATSTLAGAEAGASASAPTGSAAENPRVPMS